MMYQQNGVQPYAVNQQPMPAIVNAPVGKFPQSMVCPNCKSNIVSRVAYQTGCGTFLCCIGLMFIGCDLGCCLIPFCVNAAKDSVHYCPQCNSLLGKKSCI